MIEFDPNKFFQKDQGKTYSITELTKYIKAILENKFGYVWIEGEISNLSRRTSDHRYFTLKDANAQIAAVMFKRQAGKLKFNLEDGQAVLAYGKITVYEQRGQHQIIIERMEPKGEGALQLAFRQLKAKLESEGLFDPRHKKPLPFLPRTIGIVTSPTAAALHDMLSVLERRYSRVRIILAPAKVQGEAAPGEIAQAIENLNRHGEAEVIIAGRGGGSLEDLWAFNEEVVARAIFNSKIPVISAVGHEVDFTIADFVADSRALTPSEAAEIVLPKWEDLNYTLNDYRSRLTNAVINKMKQNREKLEYLASSRMLKDPREKLNQLRQQIDDLHDSNLRSIKQMVEMARMRLSAVAGRLNALSPLRILERGFSITSLENAPDKPLTDIKGLQKGQKLKSVLAQGIVLSEIVDFEEKDNMVLPDKG